MKRLILAAAFLAASYAPAAAELLAPAKDHLFALPATIETSDGGARIVVDYQEMRDINGRDEIPERRAHATYVDLSVRRAQRDVTVATPAGNIAHVAVGKAEGARFVVAYLHGQGGNRGQGADDFTFGGNFNRIKNLAAQNGGLYISPDFADFGATGTGQIAALLKTYAKAAPQASIFVACGSAGGAICWQLAQDADLVPRLGGLLLLGSHWNESFVGSAAFHARVPVYLGHGSRDRVFPVERQEAFFRAIRAASPGYPARFVRFESGSHGTPIRMTDWREIINWMSER